MIDKDQAKAYEIMGADVKQSGEQFGNSAKYLRWQDKAANQKFFAGEFQAFTKEAGGAAARDRHHQADPQDRRHLRHELHQVEPSTQLPVPLRACWAKRDIDLRSPPCGYAL